MYTIPFATAGEGKYMSHVLRIGWVGQMSETAILRQLRPTPRDIDRNLDVSLRSAHCEKYFRSVCSHPVASEVRHSSRLCVQGISGHCEITLAFMDDLDVVAVRIKHPCRVIAWIVFGPNLGRFQALASGFHSRFVKCIYLSMVFRYESNMHSLGIGPPYFEPEKSFLAVTEAPQIGVSVFALVIHKVCDPKWLQCLGVKGD